MPNRGAVWSRGRHVRTLMIGDVIGRPGRTAVSSLLPGLRDELNIDLVVANGENAAGGFGLTLDTADELLAAGVDVITSGNHIWDQREIVPHLDEDIPVLRPLNYPPAAPGRGHVVIKGVLVVNLIGRVFVGTFDDPFRTIADLLETQEERPAITLVDFHAEATSEKAALGWYLDGRVSAVIGTHTHVATADARLLPKGTAYVSDVGMVGPIDSIIGVRPQEVLDRFLTQVPRRLVVEAKGPVRFNSVLIDVDETGLASSIERIDRVVE